MGADEPEKRTASAETGDSGLSQFVARVLGQLSLSAWLPAAFLTIMATLVVQFAAQGSIDLGTALDALLADKWNVVILIVPVLVCVTLVTQAFSFEAIRTLEGYWRHGGPLAWVRLRLIGRQLKRKRRVHSDRIRLSHMAFLQSRGAWLDAGHSTQLVNALERDSRDELLPEEEEAALTVEDREKLGHLNWRTKCSPAMMSRVYHLSRVEEDYPADHRLLPTRLGNVMRATEDRLVGAGDDLEGFALRRREYANPRVQLQHDQFRTRLDMYCTLVFVAALLSVFTPAVLGIWIVYPKWSSDQLSWSEMSWALAITTGMVMLAYASYLAAVASARGYLAALKVMDAPEAGAS